MRILTVIDQFTRECVWLEADRSMNGPKVVAVVRSNNPCGAAVVFEQATKAFSAKDGSAAPFAVFSRGGEIEEGSPCLGDSVQHESAR